MLRSEDHWCGPVSIRSRPGVWSPTWLSAAFRRHSSWPTASAITGSVCTELCRVQLMWQPPYLFRHQIHIQLNNYALLLCECALGSNKYNLAPSLWTVSSLSFLFAHYFLPALIFRTEKWIKLAYSTQGTYGKVNKQPKSHHLNIKTANLHGWWSLTKCRSTYFAKC